LIVYCLSILLLLDLYGGDWCLIRRLVWKTWLIPSPCLTLRTMALWNLVFPLNKGQTMQKNFYMNFYIPDSRDIPMISPWYCWSDTHQCWR
jgi:hypothetical protein